MRKPSEGCLAGQQKYEFRVTTRNTANNIVVSPPTASGAVMRDNKDDANWLGFNKKNKKKGMNTTPCFSSTSTSTSSSQQKKDVPVVSSIKPSLRDSIRDSIDATKRSPLPTFQHEEDRYESYANI